MKILYLEPNALGLWNRRIERLLAQLAKPGTTIDVAHLENLPDDMVSVFLPRKPFYFSEMFRVIHRAEQDGYDAAIIGCSADPGVRDAAYFSSIPVLGPLQSALHLAGFLGGRVTVISPGRAGVRRRPASWHYETARLYGLSHRIASFRTANIDRPSDEELVELAQTDPDQVVDILESSFRKAVTEDVLTQAKLAVKEDHASVIYLGCTLWGGSTGPLAELLEVPVIDPVAGCVNMAEAVAGVRALSGK